MSKQNEKLFTDLHRLIESQNIKTEEDLQKFVESLVGQKIPSFPQETLSLKEQAQDLIYEAYELTPTKAKLNVEMALNLDPDCIEAYEYLGSLENSPSIGMIFFEKGISIGRRLFGGKYLEKHKGMFWGMHETRAFMRCLHQYANCLYGIGKEKECVAILEEVIELNPRDNQGVRNKLLLYLIELNESTKFKKYATMFKSDNTAFALFTRALFEFKTEGETVNSNKQLSKAMKQNKFVAKWLLSNKQINELPSQHGFGDENEAVFYAAYARPVWFTTKGSLEWLKKHAIK